MNGRVEKGKNRAILGQVESIWLYYQNQYTLDREHVRNARAVLSIGTLLLFFIFARFDTFIIQLGFSRFLEPVAMKSITN